MDSSGPLAQEQAGSEVVETNSGDKRNQQDGEAMGTGPIRSWMDKTLEPAELILFSWSDWELWTDLRRCMRRDSDGGERPERLLVCSQSPRLTDMCWSTTLFTAAADSANSESSRDELFFRILELVFSSASFLLLNQGCCNTSPAESRRFGVFTNSSMMRLFASGEIVPHSRW